MACVVSCAGAGVSRFLAPVWAAHHPEATVHYPYAHQVFRSVTVVALWSVVAMDQRTP